MSTFVVTYDLIKSGQNYDCVTAKLRSYGYYCHLQGSVWIIKSEKSAAQIRDNLKLCLDANDKLFVATLTGEAAWIGHSDKISKWIKENT